jgi:hypothetical protein
MQWSKYKGQMANNVLRRHHDLVDRYEISISQMTMDLLLFVLPSITANTLPDKTVYMSNTVGILL